MRFSTELLLMGNNTGIEVPPEIVTALGAGKRAPVIVNIVSVAGGFQYRSTLAVMGGRHLLPFSAERRRESGLSGGDAIEVELTVDDAPRTVEVPDDLLTALAAAPDAQAAWQTLPPSQRKAHVTAVLGAKAAETRARRVVAIITKLGG
jgi:Bacteriocin-protection, YdeI or OmpD-Associated/Domain of unknown function (DUF1905)